jgi:hypothetical protein
MRAPRPIALLIVLRGGLPAVLLPLALLPAGACQPRQPSRPEPPGAARAQPLAAAAAPMIAPVQYLRQLSLDLRGRPPTAAELDEVVSAGQVAPSVIDGMLASADFLSQVRDWHAEVLWPNLERYRVKSISLGAFKRPTYKTPPYANQIGGQAGGLSPDPGLAVDAMLRSSYVVAIEDEAFGAALRGGSHAQGNTFCDLQDAAEYPDPSVLGKPANQYVVPAERSGTGQAFTAKYYSEDPETYGLVTPIQDYLHCANFCRRTDCSLTVIEDRNNIGPRAGCFADMDTPGDDAAGRHVLDTPGMRCADGYVRELNACDFWKGLTPIGNTPLDGQPIYRRMRPNRVVAGQQPTTYNSQREGWRSVEHYWSGGQLIKTCALEAQDREHGLLRKDAVGGASACGVVTAATSFSTFDPSCGCGPKGVYCQPSLPVYQTYDESRAEYRLRKSVEQEPLEIIASVVGRDEDYLSILTTRRGFVDGPLALAYRDQGPALRGEGFSGITTPGPDDPTWQKAAYASDAWLEYQRTARHSGILTTWGFLLRFPTARSRIAQYRRAFLCSTEFDYAPKPDPTDVNKDIAARNGCSACHARLETDGLWFARYPDRTGLYLDPERYPATSAVCQYCATKGAGACALGGKNPAVTGGVVTDPALASACSTFYTPPQGATDREKPYVGVLRAAIYRDPALLTRMDGGPAEMVATDLNGGTRLQECAARTAWNRLVRRDVSDAELAGVLAPFESSGRSYRALVHAIVTGDAYRTVQP